MNQLTVDLVTPAKLPHRLVQQYIFGNAKNSFVLILVTCYLPNMVMVHFAIPVLSFSTLRIILTLNIDAWVDRMQNNNIGDIYLSHIKTGFYTGIFSEIMQQ